MWNMIKQYGFVRTKQKKMSPANQFAACLSADGLAG